MKQIVNLSDELVRNPAFWRKTPRSFYYSGHCHRGSAIETDDSCGNCDGARCESCKKVIIEPHYSFSCYSEVIHTDLLSQSYDADIASDLAYNDFGCKTHSLHMPTADEMSDETRVLIETPCKEVWDWCNSHKDVFNLSELKDQYRQIMQAKGISWCDGLDFYLNQIEFWHDTKYKFVETRKICRDDLRNLCIRHEWYTKGDCKEYDRLLDMCDEYCYLDNTKLYMMASDIILHSNMENDETITSVMFELANICIVYFDEKQNVE